MRHQYVLRWLLFVAMGVMASRAWAVPYPFADDFESGLVAWETNGLWGATDSQAHTPLHALTDSPGRFYTNGTDAAAAAASGLDLSGAVSPALTFYHRYALEAGYDVATVEISTNAGSTWMATPLATYTGTKGLWTREQLELDSYAGLDDVRLRFRLVTDESVVMDGWFIDDVGVGEMPAAPVLDVVDPDGPKHMRLQWQAGGAAPASYRVYRSQSGSVDWRHDRVVAELPGSATNYTDLTVAPKTSYTYLVMAMNTANLHAVSSEVGATTPAGMDFPMLDDGEGGGATWITDAPWALSDERAISGVQAWSDSPGALYSNDVNVALTLASTVDLRGSRQPVLSFMHQHDFAAGDSGNVEVSANAGAEWTTLQTFYSTETGRWWRVRLNLSAYTNAQDVLVRFRVTAGTSGTADGWHVDDISLAESPDAVQAPVISEVTSHTLRLTWATNTNEQFSHYAVYRSLTSGVGINATLVTQIYSRATTTCLDTGLAHDTPYYYRVYAVSPYGSYSADAGESTARTLNHPLPFVDGFETDLTAWNLTGSWGLTDQDARSGSFSLCDSPGTTYTSSQSPGSYAMTAVDLTGTTWPVLSFWDRYEVVDPDWGYVEVSTDGVNWTPLYNASGSSTNWVQRRIDLSQWQGTPNLRIRFRLYTDGSATADGWSIDEVQIAENGAAPIALPFHEGFEAGLTNWLAGSWGRVTDAPKEGAYGLADTPGHLLRTGRGQYCVLARSLDLSGTTDPQLTFWRRGDIGYRAGFSCQVSLNGGVSWSPTKVSVGQGTYPWTRYQVSLADCRQTDVRLRFTTSVASGYTYSQDSVVDQVTIEELPAGVVLDVTPGLKTMDLTWTPSDLGSDFASYEVYRHSSSPVTPQTGTWLGSFTNLNETSMTASNLLIGQTYYFNVYTRNTNDTYAPSNEGQATTVSLGLPLVDGLETVDNWYVTGRWGISADDPQAGAGCLTDSPVGNYDSSQSPGSYAMTAVDLTGTTWPVLSFWDRYEVVDPDWGYVEVSTDGANWIPLYNASGSSTNWVQRRIDLSQWQGTPNLRIRFRLYTDGSATADGWSIDEVQIAENGAAPIALPFHEGFEAGLTNWLAGSWGRVTDAPKEGAYGLADTPGHLLRTGRGQYCVLARSLDLSGTTDPQLTFWRRGDIGYRAGFSCQVSLNGGVSWSPTKVSVGQGTYPWTRYQVSLADCRQTDVRLRFTTSVASGYTYSLDSVVDQVTIEELPAGVVLDVTPGLKTMDLTWTPSDLGSDFASYEVYRHSSSPVTPQTGTWLGSFTNLNETSMTASNLLIGQTYYFNVYTRNTNDTYAPSNEGQATTVSLGLPLVDGLETVDNWYVTGRWGISADDPQAGAGCLTDSPVGNYDSSQSPGSYAMTAVDLTGTTWPVLSFWDRYEVVDPDWGYVEVSTDGANWIPLYNASGSSTNWVQRRIDLSQWQGTPNLRIRFRLYTDGSATADGWSIDEVQIAENGAAPIALPFHEGFEAGLTNWLAGSWGRVTDAPKEGAYGLADTPGHLLRTGRGQYCVLARSLDLSGTTDPQLTFWRRGDIGYRAGFSCQVSLNGGESWSPTKVSVGQGPYPWTRYQVSLADCRQTDVRLRFTTSVAGGYTYSQDSVVDQVTIEELPAGVVLAVPDQHTVASLRLAWSQSALPDFKEYRLYRGDVAGVSLADTLVTVISERSITNWVDTPLQSLRRYYYRVYAVNSNDTFVGSNETSGETQGVSLPWCDDFEAPEPAWTFTGQWGRMEGAGVSGSVALADSPADYANYASDSAVFGADLSGLTWPVLTYRERGDVAADDWGLVECSVDSGASWTTVGSFYGQQTGWQRQVVDLAPYRVPGPIWIRFRMSANSATVADGWYLDDVCVEESPVSGAAYPFYDDFEQGVTNWLPAGWSSDTSTAYRGEACVRDTVYGRIGPNTKLGLILGQELDLSSAIEPTLTFHIKGQLSYKSYFRVQISTNGAAQWADMYTLNYDWSETDWQRVQIPMSAYRVPGVRLRFLTYSTSGQTPDENIYLDDIGIGEPAPEAPGLRAPSDEADVPVLRPTLSVWNAVDYQSDVLEYTFEVFSDHDLTTQVASVPVLAESEGHTDWAPDVDLADNSQFWWRCRARDAGTNGPWMATATFYTSLVNVPPLPVILVGPPVASILHDTDQELVWQPTVDTNVGGRVVAYHLQVAASNTFASPMIDDANVIVEGSASGSQWRVAMPLSAFAGSAGLVDNTSYYWRMRAVDQWGAWSDWSTPTPWFIFGTPPPSLSGFTASTKGGFDVSWDRSGMKVVVEFTPSLSEPDWQPITEAMDGTNGTIELPEGHTSGFFRTRTVE